jgi:hypothetical protein
MRKFLPLVFCLFLFCGCLDPNVDTDAEANINTEIQASVDSFLNAHLESLIKAEVDTKVQGVGFDIKNKLADEISTQVKQDLQTQIHSMFTASTQNSGMFSGGAIYVVIVAVAFLILLFGTIIWLATMVMRWKRIWHLVSGSIEHHSNQDQHAEAIGKLKSRISTNLDIVGLKYIVDKNLEKRGLRSGKE